MSDLASFLALARDHVKSDGDDDNLLTQYVNAAVGIAAGFCRRNLYWDQASLDAAKANYLTDVTNAENAWQAARDLYAPVDTVFHCDTAQDRINARMLDEAWRTYVATMSQLMKTSDGIVIDDMIVAAMLLITGHLYRNRQEVISQVGAVAIQLPMGAQRILEPYMAV